MPNAIGRNSTVSTGRTRDAAPIGRRITHAPGAARQLMDHAERQASERQAQHEHVGHQVRLKELRRIENVSDQRHHGTGAAGEQKLPLIVRELRESVRRRFRSGAIAGYLRSRSLRSAAGTSSSVACALNCSART